MSNAATREPIGSHQPNVAPPSLDGDTGRVRAELRAARMVWWREVIHFRRDRTRMAISLLQPMLFLYVLGIGLSRLFVGSGGDPRSGADYLLFLFPGVLVMAAQALAISVGASIVWDRQSGFLREMLAAPVRRSTLLTGKCLGGATVATCQGAVVLASAGLAGVAYCLDLFAVLLAQLALAALAMTALVAMAAVTIRRVQTFNTVLTVLITPMMFLSGLMFPISAMPRWMAMLTLANPLTYAVDAMRHTLVRHQPGPPYSALFAPVAWGGWQVPPQFEVALVGLFSAVTLAVASHRFSRTN
jgi:ABC-2 type transport system permease protein